MEEEERVRPDEREDEGVLNAILIACVIGIIVVVGLIVFYPRPSEAFSALYFVNGSQYTKTPVDGRVYFNFTVENHEGKDYDYVIDYSVDNSTVYSEKASLGKEMNVTLQRSLQLPDVTAVHKVGIMLNSDPDYEIHFWTRA